MAVRVENPRRSTAAGRLSVALVRPPSVMFPRSLSVVGPTPPVGVAYVAAAIRAAGHAVEVVDGVGEGLDVSLDFETPVGVLRRVGLSPAEIVDRLPPDADVIGISNMFFHEWPQAREVAELARRSHPRAFIVIGGDNATAYWRWAFEESPAIDACVLGEGEATTVELLERIAEGSPLTDLAGVALRDGAGGDPASTGLPTRIRALGEIPRPAWDLFPVESYLGRADFLGVHRGRSMPLLGTRGCPYRCTFCSSPSMWTTRYVVRDPEDVVDEIAGYVERYRVRNINFVDLTAATKRSWILGFCDALERRNLDITWQLPVGTRSEALDREVLQRLWDTGCRNITYAPESGSPRMLRVMDKKVDLPKLETSLRAAASIGLSTHANVIIGHPEERWSDLWLSVRLLCRLAGAGCDSASAIMFSAYPGSADFDRLVDEGRVDRGPDRYYVGLSRGSAAHVSYNDRMSARQLRVAQVAIMLAFYGISAARRPGRLVKMWRAQRTGIERSNVDQFIRIKRRGYREPVTVD